MALDRRSFLLAAVGGVGLAAAPTSWFSALGRVAQPGLGPYGPLGAADPNGLRLPAGFSSRVVGRAGVPVLPGVRPWHVFPDGGATFPTGDGGWIYVSNSEVPGVGGAGAIRFAADGTIADSYSILTGTSTNCAGGPTPWGTWLSCEETDTGQVWECDPTGERAAVALPALGVFAHEAAAVDPVDRRVYLTEDRSDGRFYRFTPAAYPDLSSGALEVAAVAGDGRVTWLPVPDPSASSAPTREQVAAATPFDGGEGCWWDRGLVYFSTKGDNRIRVLDTAANTITVLYDGEAVGPDAPLTGVDNIVVTAPSGDVFVAEDGGNMEVVLITPEGEVAPFVQITGHAASEVTGPAFDPTGSRLYFSSQRGGFPLEVPIPDTPGNGLGITYEVTGPFRRQATVPAQSTPTTIARAAAPSSSPQQLPSTGGPEMGLGLVGAAAVGLAAAVARLRTRAHPETD